VCPVNFLSTLYGFLRDMRFTVGEQTNMQTVISFPASATASPELGRIQSDYLACRPQAPE